jgi:CDP-diacylglycerol--glycerol-3-phosphate 3-phosphatidyltransferase
MQGAFFFLLFTFGFNVYFYYIMITWGILAFLEHIIIQLIIPEMGVNLKGLYWVLKKI